MLKEFSLRPIVERVTKTAVSPDAMGCHPMTVLATSLIFD